MSNQRSVKTVNRTSRSETRSSIPNMATRKRSSCFGVTIGICLMILILILLLIGLEVLPSPFSRKTEVTPVSDLLVTLALTRTEGDATLPILDTQISSTPVPVPTLTQTPTSTPTLTPTSTPTEKPMPFLLRGTPQAFPNSLLHPEYACEKFLFIGGEVLDLQDAAVRGIIIRLGGTYGGDIVDLTTESGTVFIYGESGYEFVVDNKMIDEDKVFIQLEDKTGEYLSTRVYLNVSSSCSENLIIVNFKQVR